MTTESTKEVRIFEKKILRRRRTLNNESKEVKNTLEGEFIKIYGHVKRMRNQNNAKINCNRYNGGVKKREKDHQKDGKMK
jgi:hypothetical protein